MSQRTNLWFTKRRRAQTNEDYETWIEGGVVPTLNAFDNGDVRATTIIFYGNRVSDIRIQDDKINTLQARMGTGGNNMPLVASIFPIQDGREMEKKQNGLGLGSEGDPSYTLDKTGGQSVVIGIQNTVIGRSDTAGPQGKGHTEEGEPMFTVDTTSPHAVAVQAYDEYNDSVADTHHTLRAGTKQSTGVIDNSIVRRLTPLECERLQGFPDGWTEGQSDSHRYKQMGNAVAVPVVEWIIQGICDTFDVVARS